MHLLTEILLCIKIVMQSLSHKLSGVLNVSMFWPRASDRNWSVSLPPITQVARSPRSLGLFTLMLFSIMCVLSKAVASPDWSSLDAYWILSSRGVSVGSGIVTASHSHSSGSCLFVLSSTLSTGVICCMICFIGLGWVGSGGSELGCCVSGCGCRGATDIESVSCHLFRLGVLCLLGVLLLTCVT